jgi:hypothetical protein
VAIAAAMLLLAAWLAWAIYVASDRGFNEGLGVLIAWPALVAAAIAVALPLVGIYFLIRYLSGDSTAEDGPVADDGKPGDADQAQASETG